MSENAKLQALILQLRKHIAALETQRDKLKERDWNYQAVFDRVTDRLSSGKPLDNATSGAFNGLSFVVVYYDIPRQIERTLQCCSPEYQGLAPEDIEVILVDNGSNLPLPEDLQDRFPHVSQIIRIDDVPSPVVALNTGIDAARFDMLALMIDGAHMLSPGIARNAREVWSLFANPVISVPQYYLGQESQNLTKQGGAFAKEGKLLKEAGWPEDGYRLFDHAVFPGEGYHRTYTEAFETNCLITTRRVLDRCGGFDPRYEEPGGGFANLEIFSRLIHDPENSYVVLPGEGSFHQDHRGTTTQHAPEDRDRLVEGYREKHLEITGSETVFNVRSPFLYGKARKLTQRIPTISREFGRTSDKIQRQLADIFVGRVRAGMNDPYQPELAAGGVPDERRARVPLAPLGWIADAAKRNGSDEKSLSYLSCLKRVHTAVKPDLYFEIGIDTGESLSLAKCPSVGVDPAYMLSATLSAPTRIFKQKSDELFANTKRCEEVFKPGIGLAFIDGMHLAEFVLRDFIETEKWMRPGGVILFDDVLPEQMEMLDRERRFNAWCGDVFKVVPVLRRYRPDLKVSVFETFIGPYRKGLAVISGADPQNRTLAEQYDKIEREIVSGGAYDVGSIAELDKLMLPEPISNLEQSTCAREPVTEARRGPNVPDHPKLSVVVVTYNMSRELPRTLTTLSAQMQQGLSEADYEIIVVDNGSDNPADLNSCATIAPNTRFYSLPAGRASPCYAANLGIRMARADMIGVFIDGARMASPGILSGALSALKDAPQTVVGTFGYHLGHSVQQGAVQQGYDRTQEDRLLENAGWKNDGYKLFDISVLSKSSGKGTDQLPSESNAVFMHRDLWTALGGYDEQFISDGGGLANLDLWKRACEHSGVTVQMLQGEGTFHQLHNGVTTSARTSRRAEFDAEYKSIRRESYVRPDVLLKSES